MSPDGFPGITSGNGLGKAWEMGICRHALQSIGQTNHLRVSLAGVIGAALSWSCIEPFIVDGGVSEGLGVANALMCPVILGATAASIRWAGSTDLADNTQRLMESATAFLIGFASAFLVLVPARALFLWFAADRYTETATIVERTPLFLLFGRSLAWGLLGTACGVGVGVAGHKGFPLGASVLGGLLAGIIAGLTFDAAPAFIPLKHVHPGSLSRGAGFIVMGGIIAFLCGALAELDRNGQITLRRDYGIEERYAVGWHPFLLGCAAHCDVQFPDHGAIQPEHALICRRGFTFEIRSLVPDAPLFVNGSQTTRAVIRFGDRIVVGPFSIVFSESPARHRA